MDMEIKFNSSYESNILSRILDGYETSVKEAGKENTKEFASLINHMRSAIDGFEINQLFDYIGPLHCVPCKFTWTSVMGKDASSVPCPKCKQEVFIPEDRFIK